MFDTTEDLDNFCEENEALIESLEIEALEDSKHITSDDVWDDEWRRLLAGVSIN